MEDKPSLSASRHSEGLASLPWGWVGGFWYAETYTKLMECPQTGYLIGRHQALAGGTSISQLQTTA